MRQRIPFSQWVERWYYVLASHRPSQLCWRAVRILQRRFFPLPRRSATLPADGKLTPRQNRAFDDVLARHLRIRRERGDHPARVRQLLGGEFCFLNESRHLGPLGETDLETLPPVSHLWRFHFHYQEYLLDLLAADEGAGSSTARGRIWPLVDAWIRSHPIERPGALADAWHPFCLSRRIAVWILLCHAGVIPEVGRAAFLGSLQAQTRYLESHLEWDLRGNHLFENLRTLVLCGCYWEGAEADRRLQRGGRLLQQQLSEQLLDSGEHFERSPMYHAQMLLAVLDVRDAAAGPDPALSSVCGDAARSMAGFMQALLHPDGQIPLLSDSALEETPAPHILLADSGVTPSTTSGDRGLQMPTGYWIWRDADDMLLFDHGPVGADELPAHAHNDLLTMEASIAGVRAIVDSGVFDYAEGAMRSYCRSTAAHNVLQVDEAEQCDLWSRFRMGRRGRPQGLATGTDGDFTWSAATHDGFAHEGAGRVGRFIACRPGGPWIVADWAEEGAGHQLVSRLHLSPEVKPGANSGQQLAMTVGGRDVLLKLCSTGTLSLEEGWYCPNFGVRIPSAVVRLEQTPDETAMIVWMLDWSDSAVAVTVDSSDDGTDTIRWDDGTQRCAWTPRTLC